MVIRASPDPFRCEYPLHSRCSHCHNLLFLLTIWLLLPPPIPPLPSSITTKVPTQKWQPYKDQTKRESVMEFVLLGVGLLRTYMWVLKHWLGTNSSIMGKTNRVCHWLQMFCQASSKKQYCLRLFELWNQFIGSMCQIYWQQCQHSLFLRVF